MAARARVAAVVHRAAVVLLAAGLLVLVALGGFEAVRSPSGPSALGLTLLLVEGILGAFALALLASLAPVEPLPTRAIDDSPRVAILVPVSREAPEVLAETLAGVARLTWSARETWVLDDTPEDAGRASLERVAKAAGARYLHRSENRGWKAGALNEALRRVDAEYVLVLDVDHVPEPDAIERLLERFVDGRTAFVQGKLGWRNATSPFRRLAALLQLQFYEVLEREKEKRGTVVFAGSGALFRRSALVHVGGFPEETLVEDFDLTLSLLSRGWRGRFADATVARGVLPWTAADQVRQLWRWSSGTTRVLRLRAWRFARARAAPWNVRAELLLDASAYMAAGLVPLAGALLLASALLDVPLGAAATALTLFVPLLLFLAHAGGAHASLRRAGEPASARVAAYHLVSIAFTPILFASTLFALAGRVGTHGRVGKVPAASNGAGPGTLVASGVTFAFGCGLLVASTLLFASGSEAWIWAGELGIAFLLPLAFLVYRGRSTTTAPASSPPA